MFSHAFNSPISELNSPLLSAKKIKLLVQREELNHSHCMGNKWWKLKYNLLEAQNNGVNTILTFGGAFSNHIVATAYACRYFGFKSIGIIRGESMKKLNSSLQNATDNGMKLHFIDRESYREKDQIDWKSKFGECVVIPEGGTNELAVRGCQEMIKDVSFDTVCVSVGTGGTLSGIVRSLKSNQNAIGFSSLKGADFLNTTLHKYVHSSNWSINMNYHFGGYAKINEELIHFMNNFKFKYGITLDPIYTSKMFYGIFDLIRSDYFSSNCTILAVHTGGLQGIEGMNQKLKTKGWKINY